MVEVGLGDKVILRKKHPCGSFEWQIVRVGVDIGLICQGCSRRILIPRSKFNRQVKKVISSENTQADL